MGNEIVWTKNQDPASFDPVHVPSVAPTGMCLISVEHLETLAHGVEFARSVAQTLHQHFNDPAMERTMVKIREAQKEAMRLVGIARKPR